MQASLFLLYDSFTDDFIDSIPLSDLEDDEILFIASDIAEDVALAEEEFVAILANYKQVRNDIHKRKLGRGYIQGKKPTHHTRPNPSMAGPKRWTKTDLMKRTKCARCGQKGHWARDCRNPPDGYAKEKEKRRVDSGGKPYFNMGFITSQNLESFEAPEIIVEDSFVMMIGEHEEVQPASEVGSLIEVSSTNEATHTSITATTAGVEGVEAEEREPSERQTPTASGSDSDRPELTRSPAVLSSPGVTETTSIPPPPIPPFTSASRALRAQTRCNTCGQIGHLGSKLSVSISHC